MKPAPSSSDLGRIAGEARDAVGVLEDEARRGAVARQHLARTAALLGIAVEPSDDVVTIAAQVQLAVAKLVGRAP